MDYSEDFNYGNNDNGDDAYHYDNGNVNFSTNVIILLLWKRLALFSILSQGICLFCALKTKEKPQPPPSEERTVAETDCSEDKNNDNDDDDFEEIDTDSNDIGECVYHIDNVELDLDLEGAKKNLPNTQI